MTEISERCFAHCQDLFDVEVRESSELNVIGQEAFLMCNITSIALPVNVRVIPRRCFYGCKQLRSVNFASGTKQHPTQLEQIEAEAFAQSVIERIIIPESVKQNLFNKWMKNASSDAQI